MKIDFLKDCIINSFLENKNSHAFLFVTNNINKCYEYIIEIVKRVNCSNDCFNKNDKCNICNTIENNSNPDLITVCPDGKEIKVDQIKDIISLFNTKPLINKYSTYIIKEADKLNDSSSNKLLKFLEEPEGNIVGFFITEKVNNIIPTIKSRCEIFNFNFDNNNILDILKITENDYEKYFNFTLNLLNQLNDSPKYFLMNNSKDIAKKERSEIDIILNLLRNMYIMKYDSIINDTFPDFYHQIIDLINCNDIKIIVKRIKLLDNIINEFIINVNKELELNKLFLLWE